MMNIMIYLCKSATNTTWCIADTRRGSSPLSCGRCYLSADAIWWQHVANGPDTPGSCCFPPPRTAPSPECSYWLRGRDSGWLPWQLKHSLPWNPHNPKLPAVATPALADHHSGDRNRVVIERNEIQEAFGAALMRRVTILSLWGSLINKEEQQRRRGTSRRPTNWRLTVGVEASALADGVPVLDVLPPATSKGVRPVLPNEEKEKKKA